jgi:hypothetical protein
MEGTLTRFLGRFIKAGICREAAYLNIGFQPTGARARDEPLRLTPDVIAFNP